MAHGAWFASPDPGEGAGKHTGKTGDSGLWGPPWALGKGHMHSTERGSATHAIQALGSERPGFKFWSAPS